MCSDCWSATCQTPLWPAALLLSCHGFDQDCGRHRLAAARLSFRKGALHLWQAYDRITFASGDLAGSSGYIGSEVTKQCLERGYHTRAVLRSAIPEVTGPLKALGDALPGSLQLQYVPDITASGAYDEVVAGASYV